MEPIIQPQGGQVLTDETVKVPANLKGGPPTVTPDDLKTVTPVTPPVQTNLPPVVTTQDLQQVKSNTPPPVVTQNELTSTTTDTTTPAQTKPIPPTPIKIDDKTNPDNIPLPKAPQKVLEAQSQGVAGQEKFGYTNPGDGAQVPLASDVKAEQDYNLSLNNALQSTGGLININGVPEQTKKKLVDETNATTPDGYKTSQGFKATVPDLSRVNTENFLNDYTKVANDITSSTGSQFEKFNQLNKQLQDLEKKINSLPQDSKDRDKLVTDYTSLKKQQDDLLAKFKNDYGDNITGDAIGNSLTNNINANRYSVLEKNGIVSHIPDNYPQPIKTFIQSKTYLEADTQTKEYYLNKLFDKYGSQIPETGLAPTTGISSETGTSDSLGDVSNNGVQPAINPKIQFFKDLQGTIIPSLSTIQSKIAAQAMLNRLNPILEKEKQKVDSSSHFSFGMNLASNEYTTSNEELNKLYQTKQNLEKVIKGDYEGEGGFIKSFESGLPNSVPFLSSIENITQNNRIKKVIDSVTTNGKFDQTKYDNLGATDKLLYDSKGILNSFNQTATQEKYGSMTAGALSFMIEMAVLHKPSQAIADATYNGATKFVGAALEKSPALLKGLEATSNIVGKFINTESLANFVKSASTRGLAASAQATMNFPAVGSIYADKITPNNYQYFEPSANKVVNDVNTETGSNFFSAAARAWLSQAAMVGTAGLGDAKIFGFGGLGNKFFNAAGEFSDAEFNSLASTTHAPVQALKFIRNIITDTKAGDYMSRVALSDFTQGIGKGLNFLNPETYDKGLVKSFFKSAQFGSFGAQTFDMFLQNRILPVINNQHDYFWNDPFNVGVKEIKDISTGLLPIFVGGGVLGKASGAFEMAQHKFGSEYGRLNDFNDLVKNHTTDDFYKSSQELYNTANSFKSEESKEAALKIIQDRKNFENGDIKGVDKTKFPDYKTYIDAKQSSIDAQQGALEDLKNKDSYKAKVAIDLALEKAPDTEEKSKLEWLKDNIDKGTSHEEIVSKINKVATLSNEMNGFSRYASGNNPEVLKSKIESLDVPDVYKEPLLRQHSILENRYNEELKKYGIEKIENGVPNSMEVSGIKFEPKSDGTFSVTGIKDDFKESVKDISDKLSEMDASTVKALFNSVNLSNASKEFKEETNKEILKDSLSRLNNLDMIESTGNHALINVIDNLNAVSDKVKLSDEQKKDLTGEIRRAFNRSVNIAETAEDYKTIQKTAFNLNEFPNLFNLKDITDINSDINRKILLKEQHATLGITDFSVDDNSLLLPETETKQDNASSNFTDALNKAKENIKALKLGRSKSWDKALTDSVNKTNLIKIDKALNKLVETGRISETGKNLATSAIMSSSWLSKMVNLEGGIRVLTSELKQDEEGNQTKYSPNNKSITVGARDLKTSESQHIREFMEELFHSAQHNMFLMLGGDSHFIKLTDENYKEMTHESESSVMKNIADFYHSYKFNYDDFLSIHNKSISERSNSEKKEYQDLLNYMSYVAKYSKNNSREFSANHAEKSNMMNFNFSDNVNGKDFDTRKLIENYGRYKLLRDSGYNNEQSFYYSKDFKEFFARVMADVELNKQFERAPRPSFDVMVDKAKNWFSNTVKLPSTVILLKSTKIEDIDKQELFSGMTPYEIDRVLKVQSNIEEFYNKEQEDSFHKINPIFRKILFGESNEGHVTNHLRSLMDGDNSDRLADSFEKLYRQTSDTHGNEAVFNYLDHILKDMNLQEGMVKIDSKTMFDFIVDKVSGDFNGGKEVYFGNSPSSLGSIRGFEFGKMNKEERERHDDFQSEIRKFDLSPEEIFKKFGLHLDVDNAVKQFIKPELELKKDIDTKKSKVGYDYTSLDKIIDFPELYRVYPEARRAHVIFDRNGDFVRSGAGASYNPMAEAIYIGKDLTSTKDLNPHAFVSGVIHEVQHWIQHHESDFGFGSSSLEKVASRNLDKVFKALKSIDFYGDKKVEDTKAFGVYTQMLGMLQQDIGTDFFMHVSDLVKNEGKITEMLTKKNYSNINPVHDLILRDVNYYLHTGESESRLAELMYSLLSKGNSDLRNINVFHFKDTMPEHEIVYTPFKDEEYDSKNNQGLRSKIGEDRKAFKQSESKSGEGKEEISSDRILQTQEPVEDTSTPEELESKEKEYEDTLEKVKEFDKDKPEHTTAFLLHNNIEPTEENIKNISNELGSMREKIDEENGKVEVTKVEQSTPEDNSKPEELYAKRAPVIDISSFVALIANANKTKTTLDKSELYKVLQNVEINQHLFPDGKQEASRFANSLVDMWKLQLLKNELPKLSQSRIGEITKLTRVPIRAKISDYVKDIDFLEKYTTNVDFRDAYSEAKQAVKNARSRFSNNARQNVDFYMALNDLTKININMFDKSDELRDFTSLIKQNPYSVNVDKFIDKVNDYKKEYLKWKDAPEQKVISSGDSAAQDLVDDNNRRLTDFIKTSIASKLIHAPELPNRLISGGQQQYYKDPFAKYFLSIDHNNLEGKALDNYTKYLKYFVENKELDHNAYEFAQKFHAAQSSNSISEELNKGAVEMINKKVIGSTIGNWLGGLGGFAGVVAGKGEALGNISRFNLDDVFNMAEKKQIDGKLDEEIIKPLYKTESELRAKVKELLTPLSNEMKNFSKGDAIRIGMHGLLEQLPEIKLSNKSAEMLNDKLKTEEFKEGMILSSKEGNQEGYKIIKDLVNDNIAHSIAKSFGETTSKVEEGDAKEAAKLVADRRGITVGELNSQKEQALKDSGHESIYDLAKSIADGTTQLKPEQRQWLDNVHELFEDIANGVHSNGLSLKDAATIRSGVDFQHIDNYFPILRYSQSEAYSELEDDAPNKIFYGNTQDFYMSSSFNEKRKDLIMALNPNALEAVSKRVDQQLFYLMNLDHKKFLGKLFKEGIFNGKDDTSFSPETSNLFKDQLNTIFNRGVSRSDVAVQMSQIAKPINDFLNKFKPMMVGSLTNSFGHLAATVTSMAEMRGLNTISHLNSFAYGWSYLSQFASPDSPMNKFMEKYADEVYNRGLANYQIPLAKSGNLLQSSIKENLKDIAGLHTGQYASDSFVNDMKSAIRDKDLGKAVQVAALMFNTKMAARISFLGLYHNYCMKNNIKVDLENPDLKGVDFALRATGETNHTSSDIYQSFLSKNNIAGSDNMNSGEMAALGDVMFSSIFAFKQFANNQNRYLAKQAFELKNSLAEGRKEDALKAAQSLIYARVGQMLFHGIRTTGQALCYTMPIAMAYAKYSGSSTPYQDALDFTEKSVEGAYSPVRLFMRSCFDNFVLANAPEQLTSKLGQFAERELNDNGKLEKYKLNAYPYPSDVQGGILENIVTNTTNETVKRSKDAVLTLEGDKQESWEKTCNDWMQDCIYIGTGIFGPSIIPTGDMMKVLKEMEKHQAKSYKQKDTTF